MHFSYCPFIIPEKHSFLFHFILPYLKMKKIHFVAGRGIQWNTNDKKTVGD